MLLLRIRILNSAHRAGSLRVLGFHSVQKSGDQQARSSCGNSPRPRYKLPVSLPVLLVSTASEHFRPHTGYVRVCVCVRINHKDETNN